MTREEALKIVRENYPHFGTTEPWLDLEKALATLIPELAYSEYERIRKWILEKVQGYASSGIPCSDEIKMADKAIDYLEKQKENIEKEYVFRPLAGTDITIAAEQAIRRVNEGDLLVLAFNGAYIPVRKGISVNKIVDIYDAFVEKQKERVPENEETGTRKEQKPVEFTHHEIDESLRDAVTHQMEDDGDVDDFVRRGIDDIALKYAELGAKWQKEQHPSSKFNPGDWVVYDGPLGHAILQVEDVVGGRYSFVNNDSTLLEEDSDEFLRPLTPEDVEKPAESRKRNKPKESWLSRAKYEIEHADELLIQSQEELREIRELKKQEQQEVDLDADIEMEWDSFSKHLAKYGEESEEVVWLNWHNFNELARYFYELGLKARKEE